MMFRPIYETIKQLALEQINLQFTREQIEEAAKNSKKWYADVYVTDEGDKIAAVFPNNKIIFTPTGNGYYSADIWIGYDFPSLSKEFIEVFAQIPVRIGFRTTGYIEPQYYDIIQRFTEQLIPTHLVLTLPEPLVLFQDVCYCSERVERFMWLSDLKHFLETCKPRKIPLKK